MRAVNSQDEFPWRKTRSFFGNLKIKVATVVPIQLVDACNFLYKNYHSSIKDFLAREVKKQGATRVNINTSYKETKHICQYHGHNLFKGLIMAKNEFSKIWLKLHVITDNHEQFLPELSDFLNIGDEYSQPEMELLSTENVAGDKKNYLGILPYFCKSKTEWIILLPLLEMKTTRTVCLITFLIEGMFQFLVQVFVI